MLPSQAFTGLYFFAFAFDIIPMLRLQVLVAPLQLFHAHADAFLQVWFQTFSKPHAPSWAPILKDASN
jgi:hypothetical protein